MIPREHGRAPERAQACSRRSTGLLPKEHGPVPERTLVGSRSSPGRLSKEQWHTLEGARACLREGSLVLSRRRRAVTRLVATGSREQATCPW